MTYGSPVAEILHVGSHSETVSLEESTRARKQCDVLFYSRCIRNATCNPSRLLKIPLIVVKSFIIFRIVINKESFGHSKANDCANLQPFTETAPALFFHFLFGLSMLLSSFMFILSYFYCN